MSSYLAVDTSSRYLNVVVKNGDKVYKSYIENCAFNHSVALMDEIDKTLDKASINAADLDYLVAVTGPGSFTGIRIGISCVKGFASALNKRAVGVTSFDMLSYNVNSGCDYIIAIDAAHGNYYVCGYTAQGFCDIQPCFLTHAQVRELNRPVYGFEELDFERYTRLNAEDCLLAAAERCERRKDGVRALYVKKCQAEEERAARLGASE